MKGLVSRKTRITAFKNLEEEEGTHDDKEDEKQGLRGLVGVDRVCSRPLSFRLPLHRRNTFIAAGLTGWKQACVVLKQ